MRRRARSATETGRTSGPRPKPGRPPWPGDQPFYMTGPLGRTRPGRPSRRRGPAAALPAGVSRLPEAGLPGARVLPCRRHRLRPRADHQGLGRVVTDTLAVPREDDGEEADQAPDKGVDDQQDRADE